MSAPSFQFKGSGWYVTDYGGKSGGEPKEPKSSDKPEKGSAKNSDSESSDSKSSDSTEKKSSSS
jgi:predicted nucleic acid-binding Zn ribbon protein